MDVLGTQEMHSEGAGRWRTTAATDARGEKEKGREKGGQASYLRTVAGHPHTPSRLSASVPAAHARGLSQLMGHVPRASLFVGRRMRGPNLCLQIRLVARRRHSVHE